MNLKIQSLIELFRMWEICPHALRSYVKVARRSTKRSLAHSVSDNNYFSCWRAISTTCLAILYAASVLANESAPARILASLSLSSIRSLT